MYIALDMILRRLITTGHLTVHWPDGRETTYTGEAGPTATMVLRNWTAVRRLVLNPALAFGEIYMDGLMSTGGYGIYELLDVMMSNLVANPRGHLLLRQLKTWRSLTRGIAQFNPKPRARANVAHHYDLDGRLYSLFLDRDRQYSCAYFANGNETLEAAQAAKKRHIAAKLCLDRPGLTVLDIGCGWGGMALTLARDYGARVTGITLSQEQLIEARRRAAEERLDELVNFELLDYRALNQEFDRIVSVGMFEHVGIHHYSTFFKHVAKCLKPDGIALLHAIGSARAGGATNPWITKYIFPGGYCPAVSEVLGPLENSGLLVTDIEILRLHYAETLRHWRWRFAANRDVIASLYDERFCRMFEFYLACSELSFRRENQMVFQIQMAHQSAAVPLTRDYIQAENRVVPVIQE